MKKIFILALALSLSMTNDCRAQKIDFRLFDNTALSDSTRLDHIVINREGRSANDLYSDYLSVINSIATSSNSVQVSEGRMITLFNHCSYFNQYGKSSSYYLTFDYRLQFQFKDGKVKVCAPWLDNNSVRLRNDKNGIDMPNDPIDALRTGVNAFSGFFNKLITDIIQKADKVNEW